MKAYEVLELQSGLNELNLKELPIKAALIVRQNISAIKADVENIGEVRNKILKKYEDPNKTAQLHKDGKYNLIGIQSGKEMDLHKEQQELDNQEVEVKLKKIKLDDLGDINVKPIVLKQLECILEGAD